MAMGNTAEVVARRYQVSRESQDEYALQSQQRYAAAAEAGYIGEEIAPMNVEWRKVIDKETKETAIVAGTVDKDECNRPTTTSEAPGCLSHIVVSITIKEETVCASPRGAIPRGEAPGTHDPHLRLSTRDVLARQSRQHKCRPECAISHGLRSSLEDSRRCAIRTSASCAQRRWSAETRGQIIVGPASSHARRA